MLFRPGYLKEGPGIDKNAPKKEGFALFIEILAREFWEIIKLNVFFIISSIPVFTFGMARAAMARSTILMVRDVPNDAWEDYKDAIKENKGVNIVFGLIELACLVGWYFLRERAVKTESPAAVVVSMLFLCLVVAFFQSYWPLQAAIVLSTKATVKNTLLLMVLRPKALVLGLLANAVLLFPCFLTFPLSLPVLLLLPFGLSSFISAWFCWESCEKYLIKK